MNKDFKRYVKTRIKNVLIKDQEYEHLQTDLVSASRCKNYEQQEEIINKLDSVTKELCYIQGFKDAMRMILKLNRGGE